MKNVLAIETSGALCTVGLSLDGNRFFSSEHVAKRHNERLLPMLTGLTEMAGLSRTALVASVDVVAFGRGPGSFTGVRIAAAAAQAIALAAGARMLRISSSEVLAERALATRPEARGVLTSIRSRRDLHYLAAWRNVDGVPTSEQTDQLYASSPDESFYQRFEHWLVTGQVPDWWRGAQPGGQDPDGNDLLTVAFRCLARGEDVDVALGLPEYLAGDSPWRKAQSR